MGLAIRVSGDKLRNLELKEVRMSGSAKRFRCIALDAVGTLIYAEPSVAAAYALHGQRFGSRLPAEEVRRRFAEAFRRADELAVEKFGEPGRTNEQHEREFWRQVVRDVLPDVVESSACFKSLFEHFGQPESWRCFDDVAATLKELGQRGYRVLIASNFDARLNRVCNGLAELRDVRCRVISSLVGYRKTHRGFYSAVVEAAECDSSEVLMVGDDLVNDVESARAAGIAAMHLRREADHAELRRLTDLLEVLP
ncbi:MAG: HAD family hydrolase [Planctomycetota bacterium]|nr:MAG: HAD family hydrolase [Planctomycetota bacterium]